VGRADAVALISSQSPFRYTLAPSTAFLKAIGGTHGAQELVVIGVGMDAPAIVAALDSCLLDDGEMSKYRTHFTKKPAAATTADNDVD
jgi:hypothetical protein